MIIKKLEKVKSALMTVAVPVFHYNATKKLDSYIVWAETGEESPINADDSKYIQVIVGVISYVTKTEYDENVDLIQSALRSHDIGFVLEDVSYNESSKKIEYSWEFRVM